MNFLNYILNWPKDWLDWLNNWLNNTDQTTIDEIAIAVVSSLILVFLGFMCNNLIWKLRHNTPRDNHVEPAGSNALHYSNVKIKTTGRKLEIKKLRSFMKKPNPFLWCLITGEGGTGKSKLCYDFMKNMKRRWWKPCGWQPCMPKKTDKGFTKEKLDNCIEALPKKTLFILDYAEYNTREITQWMADLTESRYNKKKIRVILIQRRQDRSQAYLEMIRNSCGGYQFDESPLKLEPIDEPFMEKLIAGYIQEKKASAPPEKVIDASVTPERVINKLIELDKDLRRPLYALMIADAFIEGRSITDNKSLMEYIYGREKQAIVDSIKDASFGDDDSITAMMLKAIATMRGSVSIKTVCEELEWKEPKPKTFQSRSFGKNPAFAKDETCEPIEPDIIGAYFVFRFLGEDCVSEFRDKCIRYAWQCDENYYMRGFMTRLMQECETSSKAFDSSALSWFSAVEIMKGETEIAAQSFKNHIYIEKLTIPASVKSIGFEAFNGCEKLEEVSFDGGSKLKSIGTAAFYGCKKLHTVNLPNSLDSIGSHAFECCPLENVTVPPTVKKAGQAAFYGCGVKFEDSFDTALKKKLLGGETLEFGGLTWDVLDERNYKGRKQKLIVTHDVIEYRAYDDVTEEEWRSDEYSDTTWEECSLRAYLNDKETVRKYTQKDGSKVRLDFRDNGFLQRFIDYDRAKIWHPESDEEKLKNGREKYITANGQTVPAIQQPSTCDRVFLLSIEEVIKYYNPKRKTAKEYLEWCHSNGFNLGVLDEELLKNSWFPAEFPQSEDMVVCDKKETWWWWLRSPGGSSYYAAGVYYGGYLLMNGTNTFRESGGVRPALWLNLES